VVASDHDSHSIRRMSGRYFIAEAIHVTALFAGFIAL
jgi:hypothetical protein